jgi:hypothetical protein
MIPATILVAVQELACLFFGIWLGVETWPPFWNYGKLASIALMVPLAILSVHSFWLCCVARPESPLAYVTEYFSARRRKLGVFMWGVVLAYLQLTCLTWTKSLIPIAGPLWADHFLANLDFWLFGIDPWRIMVPVLAPVGQLVDILYGLWLTLLMLMLAAVLYAPASARKANVAFSFFTTTALTGVFGQFLLPSGGPIYWERLGLGDRFAALPSEPHARLIANYLWRRFTGEAVDFGTGISAFPSMHVALTAWMVFAIHALFPKLRPLAWFYFFAILVGSVYLGWHYLVDSIAGAIGAVLCYWLAGTTLKSASLLPRPARVSAAPVPAE